MGIYNSLNKHGTTNNGVRTIIYVASRNVFVCCWTCHIIILLTSWKLRDELRSSIGFWWVIEF